MTTEFESQARGLLRLDPENPGRLKSRESTRLEFKENFNWASRAKYAKTHAAFANNSGGFIVFGVADSPRELVGVDGERFDYLASERFTGYLNAAFAPELEWEAFTTRVGNVQLGVLHVAKARARPVVALRNAADVIRESDIFYRYRARSDRIRYPELENIFKDRQERERDMWLDHLSRVARVGVENVAVLDFLGGKLSGRGGQLLVSSDLLEKVEFIREGHFVERNEPGMPALRLVGDVQAVTPQSIGPVRTVPLAIGERDILLAFLRQGPSEAPTEYLRQASRESSPYMPVYHFARCANLGLDALRDLVSHVARPRSRLIRRVEGQRVGPVGSLNGSTPHSIERREILDALNTGDIEALRHRDRNRLFEAITHVSVAPVLSGPSTELLGFLADLVETEFETITGNVQTACRKAIAHLDEELNWSAVAGSL